MRVRDNNTTQLDTRWLLQLPFIDYADVPPKPNVSSAYLRTSLVNPQTLDSSWLTRIVTLDPVPNLVVQPTSVAKLVTNPQPLNNSWLLQQPFIDYASITPLAFQPAAYNRVQPALPQQLNTSFLTQLTQVVFDPVPAKPYQTAPQIPPYYQVRLQSIAPKWLLDYVNPVIPPVPFIAIDKSGGGQRHKKPKNFIYQKLSVREQQLVDELALKYAQERATSHKKEVTLTKALNKENIALKEAHLIALESQIALMQTELIKKELEKLGIYQKMEEEEVFMMLMMMLT